MMWRDLLFFWLLVQVLIIWRAWCKVRARRVLGPRLHTVIKIPREAMFDYIDDEVKK